MRIVKSTAIICHRILLIILPLKNLASTITISYFEDQKYIWKMCTDEFKKSISAAAVAISSKSLVQLIRHLLTS